MAKVTVEPPPCLRDSHRGLHGFVVFGRGSLRVEEHPQCGYSKDTFSPYYHPRNKIVLVKSVYSSDMLLSKLRHKNVILLYLFINKSLLFSAFNVLAVTEIIIEVLSPSSSQDRSAVLTVLKENLSGTRKEKKTKRRSNIHGYRASFSKPTNNDLPFS